MKHVSIRPTNLFPFVSILSMLLLFTAPPLTAREERAAPSKGAPGLKVLYVGESGEEADPARAEGFRRFLEERFREVKVTDHDAFRRADAEWADVVVLDWFQGMTEGRPAAPIGKREDWNRPTVLIGSAGLMLAMSWDVLGGSG